MIPVGVDESVAMRALDWARRHIGQTGTVTIADRISLPAEDILSVRIEEHAEPRRVLAT